MTKSLEITLGLLGLLGVALADTQTCGTAPYDPALYVCHDNTFLCPIVAGEGLSYCSGACYSTYMYSCTNNALTQLPALPAGTPFTLTATNPAASQVDGLAVDACNQRWNIGIETCSYCPADAIGADNCPAGNTTVLSSGGSNASTAMDVVVPGGQQIFIDAYGAVGYTQAHSASMPENATTGGLVAYSGGGGFVNLNSGGYGWVACPPTAMGGGGDTPGFTLFALTADNKDQLNYCFAINLKVTAQPDGTVGAWQYT